MAMTLDDLQLLLDVANRGSFSKVAAIRGWSQPMVSQRIAVLEQELGQSLFRRHRRGATPTPACTSAQAAGENRTTVSKAISAPLASIARMAISP